MIINIFLSLVIIFNFLIFVFVYKSAKTRLYARYFSYFIIFANLWLVSNYLIDVFTSREYVVLVTKVTFASVSMMATALLLFAIYYPIKDFKLRSAFEYLILLPGLIISGLSFSQLIVKDIIFNPIANEVVFGWLNYVYFAQLISYLLLSIFFMIHNYLRIDVKLKSQMQYLFMGIVLSLFISLVTNALMPLLFNNFSLSVLGPFSMIIFIGFTSYAVIKHKLMDIRLIVARSLTYFLLLAIFAVLYMLTVFIFGGLIFGQFTGKEAYWASMVIALLVGFTFYPLKRWFTHWTDKVFFKDRYDFEDLTAQLNETATSTIILPELLFKFLNLLIDEMRIMRGAFVLLEKGRIFESQTLGYKRTIDLIDSEIEHLTKEKKIEVFDEAEEGSVCKEIMRKYDAMVILPLIAEHELIGVLFLGDKKSGDSYSQKDINVLKIVSNQLALGIQNAKAYEQAQKFNLILRAEINRATKEARDANIKLQELDRSKDEFISLASHEIRTPIATLEGYLSLLVNQKLKPKDKIDISNRAYDSIGRLSVLAKDLLDTSRIDQEHLILNKEPTRIERLIERVVEGFEFRSKEKGIYVEYKKADKMLPEISLDPGRITEVFNNIVGNAIKFTHKGGITISVGLKDKNTVLVKIADTGEGIPKDDIPNLFKKFYQAQAASSILSKDKGGTGLGLYITKNIIDIHGGKIWIESRVRRGTTFYFTLPTN